ncbi:trypsin-1 [Halyomorpha halys]|uniref:trypsin-1 n=1 Tax=Halyomorpha halys TaxID=286706 RepID=UPI0006D4C9CB|nr:chymotrypsin-C-like [Halyomorpha halys]
MSSCLLLSFALPLLLPAAASYAQDQCGVSKVTISYRQPRDNYTQGRIVNGKPTLKGAWPWQVSLEVLHPKYGLIGHWCGGVLVNPSWLITAAHCVHNDIFNLPLPALWTAVLGDWDRNVEEETEARIPIDEILIHQSFRNYQNDIALMRLSREAKGLSSVCLESDGELTDRICTATGWGRNVPAGPLSARLRQVRVPLHKNSLCQDKYGPGLKIEDGHLCAGKLDGSTGACIGDSGGPLQCRRQDGRWFLIGITSFGSGCAKPGYPDVYTRLSYYLPWVLDNINN